MEIKRNEPTNKIARVCRISPQMAKSTGFQLRKAEYLKMGIVFLVLSWFMLLLLPFGIVLILYSQKSSLVSIPVFLRSNKTKLILVIMVLGFVAWAPWMTDDYAIDQVTEHLGGPDELFDYIGDTMPVSSVPKSVVRVPFGSLVYFPSEARFRVTFWGWVI